MNIKYFLVSFAVSLFLLGCCPTEETVCSPDGNLSLSLNVDKGNATISIYYKSQVVLEKSPVGIEFADGLFAENLKIVDAESKFVVDDYNLYSGKSSKVHSESNEMLVSLSDDSGREVDMFLRAFNDGVAYRYYIPKQDKMTELAIKREIMELNIPENPTVKMMQLRNFTTSHENLYTTKALNLFQDSLLFDMPSLISFSSGKYMAITESNVVDYAGMMLTTKNGRINGVLSPRLDDSGLSVTGELPRRSPWRVFQVSDKISDILESNIVTTLADPCKESNLSWLEPGLSTWPWWNGYQAPENLKKGDINTINQNINRYYIDFCAENNIKYHSITGILLPTGNEICWYYNEGKSTPGAPHEEDDTSIPYPEFDVNSICQYAQDKNVKMRAWVRWNTLDKNLEKTFQQYNKWGIKGLMVDYMDQDNEDMIAYQKRVLEMAMKYHLHIQFHGASKPSGLNRTYPCELTRENTYNYETYKWTPGYNGKICGSEHDLDVAFTRTLAGPSDYHLGSFRAVKSENFVPNYALPVTTSTRSHSLAMYIALESGLHLVSDSPEAYSGQTGFDFIKNVPTAWDETRVVLAEVDKYLVIARRKGDNWYLGGIGNREARDLSVPLNFLGVGDYSATIYTDAADSDQDLNHIEKKETTLFSKNVINVHMAPNGGFVATFTHDKIIL